MKIMFFYYWQINGIQVTIVFNLFIFICIIGSTYKFSCWKGIDNFIYFWFRCEIMLYMLTHVFLTLVESKVNSYSDNPWQQWVVLIVVSWIGNWIVIMIHTNSYIFDDRFNWCPFWFNVFVVIMIVFFSCQCSNFKILKHYPYDDFVAICYWCFKNVINSIHKTIIHCIITKIWFIYNSKMQTYSFTLII